MKSLTVSIICLIVNGTLIYAQPVMDTISFDVVPQEVKQAFLSQNSKNNLQNVVRRGVSTYELTVKLNERNKTLGYLDNGEYLYLKEACKLDTIPSVNIDHLKLSFEQLRLDVIKNCFCESRPNSENLFIEIFYQSNEGELKYLPISVNQTK